ncbi:MAG: rhodanese-related sulfurtransferase [Verrucomicrobiota bacterium]
MSEIVIRAFYKFVHLPDFEKVRERLLEVATDQAIKGTILLAEEGINGTVAGLRANMDHLFAAIRSDSRLQSLKYKESVSQVQPFYRIKVRLKKEIVTMGIPHVDPNHTVGTYVSGEAWNDLISDPDTVVIDTRNDYETAIGTFENAVSPNTQSFREFPKWVEENKDYLEGKKIAMFCTGGIRCEKSTAYMKVNGYQDVYHLDGGILQYLEDMPKEQSKWNGECFVFDNRVAVNHDLEPGSYDMCHACRRPLSREDMESDLFIQGVSCPHCHNQHTDERKKAFEMRQRQVELAKERGTCHIGGE